MLFTMNKPVTLLSLLTLLCVLSFISFSAASNRNKVKCLVCQQAVKLIAKEILSEDRKKKMETGSFRIEPDGSQKQSQVKYAASESHLYEVLEKLCSKMSDFAQAKHKQTGELALINLSEQVNMLSDYDFIPTEDLNESLKFYCETFAEEYEEDILKAFFRNTEPETEKLQVTLCNDVSGYCQDPHNEL